MRTLISIAAVALALVPASAYVLSSSAATGEELRAPIVSEPIRSFDSRPILPDAPPLPEAPPRNDGPKQSWCEPMDVTLCESDEQCVGPLADGTKRVCRNAWYSTRPGTKVCMLGFPSRDVQRLRADRLRVLVDEICERRDGCDPEALHDYLSVLILRETTWRPYKLHRLGADVKANARSFASVGERYADNPVADQPWRWPAGRGYFGQNTAYWLLRWDVNAIPESLCGEVEATLAHLRGARDRWEDLDRGVDCEGEEHHGTADGRPSWYSVSLVNSGNESCPGTEGKPRRVRESFEKRARSRGLDAHGQVTLPMLGKPIDRATQAAFAARVRAEMDRQYPLSSARE